MEGAEEDAEPLSDGYDAMETCTGDDAGPATTANSTTASTSATSPAAPPELVPDPPAAAEVASESEDASSSCLYAGYDEIKDDMYGYDEDDYRTDDHGTGEGRTVGSHGGGSVGGGGGGGSSN